jgi:sigma-B regulation protein RsbU (phosphoserine phosphatase)
MSDITIESADGSRQKFKVGKERVTIGRSRDCDIFLPDQWLSRHHAEIRRRGQGAFLADLRSKNGTLLNGERVAAERELRHGDVISLGEHRLTFTTDEDDTVEENDAPEGTRVFSAREITDIKSKPATTADDLKRQNRVLMVLHSAATELFEYRPLPDLFDKIMNLIFETVGPERCAILLLEGDPPKPVVKASRSRQGQPIESVSRSIARQVIEDRVSLFIPNILEDANFSAQDSILSTGIRSAICAPLWYARSDGGRDAVIGLIYLDSMIGSRSFDDEDQYIVTALANVAAARIETARLLEESLEKRRMEDDMRVASEIQRGLLPQDAPSVPGYSLCGANFPCRTVGGDYFDFEIDNGDLLFALGDVSGKGTGAALLMTMLRASVRAHWADGSLSHAAERINRTVAQNVPANKYITFFMGRLEPQTGRLTYVNAGHNPPMLIRSTGEAETLVEGGMVLGLFDSAPFDQGVTELGPQDSLIVFSDGVSETFNAQDEEYGEARLVELLTNLRDRDAPGLQAAILDSIEEFAAGAKATDDRTLIVLKRES